VGSLGALVARLATGRREHVEVSTQECVAAILELTFEFWPYCRLTASRLGAKPIQPLCFMECRDGWIFLCCVEEHQWKSLVDIMSNPEWASMELFADRLSRGANFDALQVFLQEWCREQSVHELYEAAQLRRVPLAPVSTMGALLASPPRPRPGAEGNPAETATRPCVTRLLPPFADFEPSPDRSGYFNQYNQGKKSIVLDLKRPEAIEAAKRLCAASDVVVENYAAGVMERMGLGWDVLRALRADLVMIALSGYGATGPDADKVSYGPA